MTLRALNLVLCCTLLAACSGAPSRGDADASTIPVIEEAFVTAATPEDNIDSMATWTGANGEYWLIATSKQGHRLVIYDARTGETLRTVGSPGDGYGRFNRPNGVFVHDDLLFVVERDNRRVQVLRLPDFRPLRVFGADELIKPYGIWVNPVSPQQMLVYVTDSYERSEDVPPPPAERDRRVRAYMVSRAGGNVSAVLAQTFGDTTQAGSLRVVESIWGDPARNALLIAEEDVTDGSHLKLYDFEGRYQGRDIGRDAFEYQAEGIALWQCDDGSGYWIVSDQDERDNRFHLFDRASFAHVGSFRGEVTSNTDGVWLQQAGSETFPAGAFYAAHDDKAVSAFDWRDIARATGARETCTAE